MRLNGPMTLGIGGLRRVSAPDPGLVLMQNSVSWFSSKDGAEDVQQRPSRINAADLQTFGSTAGVDANDPDRRVHTGSDFFYFPDVVGNWLTVPSSPAFALTNAEIEWRARIDSVADERQVMDMGGTQCMIRFSASLPTPVLQVFWAGSTFSWTYAEQGSPDLSAPNYWRIRVNASNGSGVGEISLSTSVDGANWTDCGSRVHGSAFAARTALDMTVGGRAANDAGLGDLYSFTMRDALSGGTPVIDIAASSADHVSFTDGAGNSVSVSRAASGLKTALVTRSVDLFDGVNDQITQPATTNRYVFARVYPGGTIEIVADNPGTAGELSGELFEVLDFASPLDAGQQSDVLSTVRAGAYT